MNEGGNGMMKFSSEMESGPVSSMADRPAPAEPAAATPEPADQPAQPGILTADKYGRPVEPAAPITDQIQIADPNKSIESQLAEQPATPEAAQPPLTIDAIKTMSQEDPVIQAQAKLLMDTLTPHLTPGMPVDAKSLGEAITKAQASADGTTDAEAQAKVEKWWQKAGRLIAQGAMDFKVDVIDTSNFQLFLDAVLLGQYGYGSSSLRERSGSAETADHYKLEEFKNWLREPKKAAGQIKEAFDKGKLFELPALGKIQTEITDLLAQASGESADPRALAKLLVLLTKTILELDDKDKSKVWAEVSKWLAKVISKDEKKFLSDAVFDFLAQNVEKHRVGETAFSEELKAKVPENVTQFPPPTAQTPPETQPLTAAA